MSQRYVRRLVTILSAVCVLSLFLPNTAQAQRRFFLFRLAGEKPGVETKPVPPPPPDYRVPKIPAAVGPHSKPGFVTAQKDNVLWVFRAGGKDLTEFQQQGELARHITLVGEGPRGLTLKAADKDTILEWKHTKNGFVTLIRDGRIWVFRDNMTYISEFLANGELAKHTTRPGGGPEGMTIKAPDGQTIDTYMASP